MKVVFLVMSGDEKLGLALRMAYNSIKNKRYDDLKLLFSDQVRRHSQPCRRPKKHV